MQQDSPQAQQLSFLSPNLIDQLNPKHPLLQLAKRIPWDYLKRNSLRFTPTQTDPRSRFGSWTACVF